MIIIDLVIYIISRYYPSYYEEIKKPVSINNVQKKIKVILTQCLDALIIYHKLHTMLTNSY